MRISLHDVSKGRNGQALPSTSLEFHTGEVRYALAETEQRPTVLGLIASGRMRPDTGRVTIDGSASPKDLRRRVALVDAPDASDPHADISLAGVVGEELMFAGLGATPLHARRWLSQLGYSELASVPIGSIDPAARVRILCELAVLRDGTDGVVLVSPDRHGGSPDGWWRIAREFAERGFAMLVIVGGSAAVALERMRELGAINASGPVDLDASALRRAQSPNDDETEQGEALRLAPLAQEPAPAPEPEPEPEPAPEPEPEREEETRSLSEERSDETKGRATEEPDPTDEPENGAAS